MNSFNNKIDFANLLSSSKAKILLKCLTELASDMNSTSTDSSNLEKNRALERLRNEWQCLSTTETDDNDQQLADNNERVATDWLIQLFNTVFADQKVILVRSEGEPEYFPAQNNEPARIEFAHGFFASALHEISHWCVAGEARRRLPDFGYWYAPDGRSAAQQQSFERVEIKPQALECLFTLGCGRPFQVSQDNLFAEFDTSDSTFEHDVYQQAKQYITKPQTLPRDAKKLLLTLLEVSTHNSIKPMAI
ncbi:elongation factor P hydroxylase [Psychrobacter sp. NZS113]|uniref:elongation factor P hydroxylase n=1 Tax=Psychrobacter sp. NZS113 TaxID=2792045 RepID=UPI0018CDCCF7|nr:elongation factor P hydroxylase [Psychrobacter sp. NZS113]MBH0097225.1 elongation factor P hydroxylase [Psychrobacter sp. NZS113]